MRFESKADLQRERRAMDLFCSQYNLSSKKLGDNDVDFMVFNANGDHIGFAEVKGRPEKSINDDMILSVSIAKLHKLQSKRLNPIIIWACEDGIIYAKAIKLRGKVKWQGRTPRRGASNDEEFMVFFENQPAMQRARY